MMTRIPTFATACAAGALFAGGAFAAEPLTATVSGYMHVGVGVTDVAGSSGSGDNIGILRDGEIHLGFKGTSDNGLTFDGRVELEAFTTGDQIDENWARVSGSFGAIMIGGNDEAKDQMTAGVLYSPGTKVGYYDDDVLQGLTGLIDGAGDGLGVHYYSPSLYGFTAGLSFIADVGSDGANDAQYAQPGDSAYSASVRYDGGYADATYAFSGGWIAMDTSTGTQDTYSLGGEGTYAGFTVAAYWEQNFDETNDYAFGVAYKTGPWTFAGGYSLTELDGAPDTDTYSAWATYAIAPGVSTSAGAAYADNGDVSGFNSMAWMSLYF